MDHFREEQVRQYWASEPRELYSLWPDGQNEVWILAELVRCEFSEEGDWEVELRMLSQRGNGQFPHSLPMRAIFRSSGEVVSPDGVDEMLAEYLFPKVHDFLEESGSFDLVIDAYVGRMSEFDENDIVTRKIPMSQVVSHLERDLDDGVAVVLSGAGKLVAAWCGAGCSLRNFYFQDLPLEELDATGGDLSAYEAVQQAYNF